MASIRKASMIWLVEDPVSILLLGLVAGSILLVVLVQTRHASALIAFVGALLLTLVLLAIEAWVVTDTERIEAVVYAVAAALKKNDTAAVVRNISTASPVLRAEIERRLPQYEITDAKVASRMKVSINRLTNPPSAIATFLCRIDGKPKHHATPYEKVVRRFSVTLTQENDRWFLSGYESP